MENFESDSTGIKGLEVLFGVLPTKVAFFAKPTYKVGIDVGENKSALYSTNCLVDTTTRLNLIT